MSMTDPTETLRLLLFNSWSLTDELAKANIKFYGGWFNRKTSGYYHITVTESDGDAEYLTLGGTVTRVRKTYYVDAWAKVKTVSARGISKAHDYKWDMRQEILDILKVNMTGVSGIKYVWINTPERPLDELTPEPPIMHWQKEVDVIYDI